MKDLPPICYVWDLVMVMATFTYMYLKFSLTKQGLVDSEFMWHLEVIL